MGNPEVTGSILTDFLEGAGPLAPGNSAGSGRIDPATAMLIVRRFRVILVMAYDPEMMTKTPMDIPIAMPAPHISGAVIPLSGILELDNLLLPWNLKMKMSECEFIPAGTKVTRRISDICRSRIPGIVLKAEKLERDIWKD
jgi:hypothetical protein